MKNTDYTKGTLRKPTSWDEAYMNLSSTEPEPEPIHWGYKLIGMVLAMVLLSWVGAWIAEGLTP